MRKITLILTLLLAGAYADAQMDSRERGIMSHLTGKQVVPSVSLLYGSFDDENRSGDGVESAGIKIVGSQYFADSNWIADYGLGAQKIYDDREEPTLAILSLDGRYDFGRGWTAGPIADIYLGNGEDFGNTNNQTAFLGVTLMKDFALSEQLIRLGLKYTAQAFVEDQDTTFGAITVEWGFPGAANRAASSRVE